MAGLRIGVFVLATLAALPAQDEGIDLEAIAAELAAGGCPEIRPLLPGQAEGWSREVTGDTPRDVLVATVRIAGDTTPPALAAAVRLLMQDDAERETEAGLLAEIHACKFLSGLRRQGQNAQQPVAGENAQPHWIDEVMPAARLRARALQARLLRQHGDISAAGAVLLSVRDRLGSANPDRVLAAATTRLEMSRDPFDLLWLASDAIERLDFASAESTLERAEHAAHGGDGMLKKRAIERAFQLRRLMVRAREIQGESATSAQEQALRTLRVLQVCSWKRAAPLSKKLVAEGFEHALPYSILACSAFTQSGDRHEALEMLERAESMPGRGLTYAALANVLDILWRLRETPDAPDDEKESRQRAQSMLTVMEDALTTDRSGLSSVCRLLRALTPMTAVNARTLTPDVLDEACSLSKSLPHSRAAYLLLLFAAERTEDRAAARAAVAAPIPAPLRSLHELARLRATTWLLLELAQRQNDTEQFEELMAELARVQADGRDAAYLRGVRLWHRATGLGADPRLMRAAREQFLAAQRGYGERGLAQTACALAVVDVALGKVPDFEAVSASRQRDAAEVAEQVLLPPFCLGMLAGRLDDKTLQVAPKAWQKITFPPTIAVLNSALAVAYRRNGNEAGMRLASTTALEALRTNGPGTAFTRLPQGRGVLVYGSCQYTLGVYGVRPDFTVDYDLDLWVVPKLPTKAYLEDMARGE